MSPPTTPRARQNPPTSYPKSTRLAAATATKTTFAYEHNTDRDLDDEYDLTYTFKHVPRASMVDNLVMSLDQFSNISTKSTSEEDGSYRARGHTFSSSVSSESDIHTLTSRPGTTQSASVARRNSLKYAKDPARLPSIYGEDEDSIRTRVYESQRADFLRHKTKSNNATPLTVADAVKDPDLAHLKHLQGKLGPAGNRRSQSFDFGSQSRPGENELYADSNANSMTSPSTAVPVPRRNSARSVQASQNKPSTPGSRFGVSASQTPATTSVGKSTASISDSTRPGLFKRFFGSSLSRSAAASNSAYTASPLNSASHQSSEYGQSHNNYAESVSSARVPRPTRKPSLEANNKENIHPLHSKKSTSSFFRRRKKSIAVTSAVPLPLTLQHLTNSTDNPDQSSPVSSLKAFMDPYLVEEGAGRDNSRTLTSPLQKFYTPPLEREKLALPQGGDELKRVDSTTDTDETIREAPGSEHVPSYEDSRSKSSQTTVSAGDNLTTGEKGRQIGPRAASSNAVHSTIRPVIEIRSTSLTNTLNIPARKESLLALDNTHHSSAHPLRKDPDTTLQNKSASDVSNYQSASSTPARQHTPESKETDSPRLHVSHPSISKAPVAAEVEQAKRTFENGEELIDSHTAAEWLGEAGSDRERVRNLYMELFDWTGHNILNALRSLCSRLALRAESQLIDRILDAFAQRWCQCNPTHGFRSADVVHTICYSILLLNTDLHMADIGSKMTRNQFVKNSMQTIRPVAADTSARVGNPTSNPILAIKQASWASDRPSIDKEGRAASAMGQRPGELTRTISEDAHAAPLGGPLVEIPFSGSDAGWEVQIEGVLKEFYHSIQREPLPLFGCDSVLMPRDNNLLSLSGLRRTPSTLSRTQAETVRGYNSVNSKILGNKWSARTRSRARLGSTPGYGSSKTSLEDQSSGWSPSISSTWSKGSLGKTLASMSVDSFGTEVSRSGADQPASVGFASALSQAIIREDQLEMESDDGMKNVQLLEDETLELEGAPWAKEGILKHKCHLDETEKKYKDRTWNDCFAVIEKGWMRLFSFSSTAKSLRARARSSSHGAVVGGGNWQDNAEEVWKFMLRHTIASALPPPGYSKARPHVFALQLHTGSIHLFAAGTADIVKEFVSTANFWSARLSKEPMIGGVSSMEYGWSDAVLSQAGSVEISHGSVSSGGMEAPRPSTQMSIRSSIDQGGPRARLPGDRIYISDWSPPQTSMFASQLSEVEQRKALETYVQNTEADHQIHNDLRPAMLLAFSPKHPNYARAMGNWERKSQYMLTEIVKFKGYIESLQSAQAAKERIYKMRKEEDENKMNQLDSMAFHNTTTIS